MTYDPLKKIDEADIHLVDKGWLHLQHMDQRFASCTRPEVKDLRSGVVFLRVLVQRALTEYMVFAEKAVMQYASENLINPYSRNDAEFLEINRPLTCCTSFIQLFRYSTKTS